MRKCVLLAALVAATAAVVSGSAGAAPPETLNPGLAHTGGYVPALNAAYKASGAGLLKYHGGPVMHTNTTYAIYWVPAGYAVSSQYESLINRFFGDVAAATSAADPSNVYYTSRQYSDGSGSITYAGASFGGSYVDTSPLPASGCSDSYTSVCLTDAQIQSEINRVIAANGWAKSSTTQFFMFTAKGIGSCSGSSCAFSNYCAYHGYNGSLVYANMPYADTVPSACDAGYHPNNDDADATINVTSHEHNEAITDENLNAWYDRAGYENGDKCAWKFGAVSSDGGNQTIGGHRYILQLEYSNQDRGCVQSGL